MRHKAVEAALETSSYIQYTIRITTTTLNDTFETVCKYVTTFAYTQCERCMRTNALNRCISWSAHGTDA